MRDALVEHAQELLSSLGNINVRRMFGGHGIHCDGLFIAIVSDDVLYLKSDVETPDEFERAGCKIFSYLRQGKLARLNFYRAPEDALDAPHLMLPWGRKALAAALRVRVAKPVLRNSTGRSRRPVENTNRQKS
jgi:DNA transformation protein